MFGMSWSDESQESPTVTPEERLLADIQDTMVRIEDILGQILTQMLEHHIWLRNK